MPFYINNRRAFFLDGSYFSPALEGEPGGTLATQLSSKKCLGLKGVAWPQKVCRWRLLCETTIKVVHLQIDSPMCGINGHDKERNFWRPLFIFCDQFVTSFDSETYDERFKEAIHQNWLFTRQICQRHNIVIKFVSNTKKAILEYWYWA